MSGSATLGGAGAGASAGAEAGGAAGSNGPVDPCVPSPCNAQATCTAGPTGAVCTCRSGFTGDGKNCQPFPSCDALHRAEPNLGSGVYTLRPQVALRDITAYCEMKIAGGGWTLAFNQGPSFDPLTTGLENANCYSSNCTSAAYAMVPMHADLMLDLSDGDIVGETFLARAIVTGAHANSRDKTLRTLFTTGPYFLEKEDNSNVTLDVHDALGCAAIPRDMSTLLCNPCGAAENCGTSVIVLGDRDSACAAASQAPFAIGASVSYSVPWTNCAGWPQAVNYGGFHFYPNNFRLWVR
jgi:hypothetical protein